MDALAQIAKSLIAVPLGALVSVPFLRVTAKLFSLRPLSFGAAFMFGLILGGVLLAVSVVFWLVMPDIGVVAETAVSVVLSLLVSSALAGYFLSAPDGTSIGIRRGLYFTVVSEALFGVALFCFALVVVALFGNGKI